MAWLETPLLVIHNFVGKHEDWLAACGGYFGSLGVGNDSVKDDPLLDDAEGHPFVTLSGQRDGFVEGQFGAIQADSSALQQTIATKTTHPLLLNWP